MKSVLKILLAFSIFMPLGLTIQAQDGGKEYSATIGVLKNYEEIQFIANGIHLGFNRYSRNSKRFTTDLQVSLNYSSGVNTSQYLTINALYGGRLYFTQSEKPLKIFTNLLIGPAYIFETGDDFYANRFNVGYSFGLFLSMSGAIIGVSAESYKNFTVKLGYIF